MYKFVFHYSNGQSVSIENVKTIKYYSLNGLETRTNDQITYDVLPKFTDLYLFGDDFMSFATANDLISYTVTKTS